MSYPVAYTKEEAFEVGMKEMMRLAYENADNKGFWDDADGPDRLTKDERAAYRELWDCRQVLLMHSELSEATEAYRKNLDSDHIPGFTGAEEEFADEVLRIMQFAEGRKLRLVEAIIAKMEFNRTRPKKHGGKKF